MVAGPSYGPDQLWASPMELDTEPISCCSTPSDFPCRSGLHPAAASGHRWPTSQTTPTHPSSTRTASPRNMPGGRPARSPVLPHSCCKHLPVKTVRVLCGSEGLLCNAQHSSGECWVHPLLPTGMACHRRWIKCSLHLRWSRRCASGGVTLLLGRLACWPALPCSATHHGIAR